ncbi:MAG: maleylpyruvate isomerase N-terminal domain-containing protein [Actinomycetota bacterium]|nr:maleylpyruvate isomerase N-terminal domain-containing protein [Actinomycetota bacterium]
MTERSLGTITELLRAEEEGWKEIHALIDSLSPSQVETRGYFPEGWSVKDLLGHLASWLAEAGVALERINGGTYREGELDIDAKNDEFMEALRPLTSAQIHGMAESARARMRRSLLALSDESPDAAWWIDKAGIAHYRDHLPRLRDWVEELRAGA